MNIDEMTVILQSLTSLLQRSALGNGSIGQIASPSASLHFSRHHRMSKHDDSSSKLVGTEQYTYLLLSYVIADHKKRRSVIIHNLNQVVVRIHDTTHLSEIFDGNR